VLQVMHDDVGQMLMSAPWLTNGTTQCLWDEPSVVTVVWIEHVCIDSCVVCGLVVL